MPSVGNTPVSASVGLVLQHLLHDSAVVGVFLPSHLRSDSASAAAPSQHHLLPVLAPHRSSHPPAEESESLGKASTGTPSPHLVGRSRPLGASGANSKKTVEVENACGKGASVPHCPGPEPQGRLLLLRRATTGRAEGGRTPHSPGHRAPSRLGRPGGRISHHRSEPGHRSHFVVLGPGLQVLQREEGRIVQAQRVWGQRRPQRPRERVLLQVQEQPSCAVPLRLALLRRLAPGRAEKWSQRGRPGPRPPRAPPAPRLTATWCAGSGTRS